MKPTFLISLILFFVTTISAQDTLYFDVNNKKVNSREQAHTFRITVADSIDPYKALEITYWNSGKIKSEEPFSFEFKYNADKSIIKSFSSGKLTINSPLMNKSVVKRGDGRYREWNETGQLYKEIDFRKGAKNGKSIFYWDNGQPKRIEVFEDDRFVSGKCFNREAQEINYTPYRPKPEFPGGNKAMQTFINTHLRYPVAMQENGIQGVFQIKFIVKKDGQLSDIDVVQKNLPGLYQEATRLLALMPTWLPALRDGEFEPIDYKYTLPISFMMK